MPILSLFVVLCIFGCVFWGARTLMEAFQFPAPARAVVIVAIVLIFVLGILQSLGGGVPLAHFRL